MHNSSTDLSVQDIRSRIHTLPGRPPFMLASDLAIIYQTERRQINQAVRRNPDRFPEDFCFKLEPSEVEQLRRQAAEGWLQNEANLFTAPTRTASQRPSQEGWLQNEANLFTPGSSQPRAFTRLGANQLSMVLKSKVAAQRSIQIIRAFSLLEEQGPAAILSADERFLAGIKVGYRRGMMLYHLYEKHSVPKSAVAAYLFHRQQGYGLPAASSMAMIRPKKAREVEAALERAGIALPKERKPNPLEVKHAFRRAMESPPDHELEPETVACLVDDDVAPAGDSASPSRTKRGRPRLSAEQTQQVIDLAREGLKATEIALRVGCGRTTVLGILSAHKIIEMVEAPHDYLP